MMLFLIIQKDEKTKEEKRLCICDKDRDNKKKWTEDITEIQASVETHIYRDDIPEMTKI